VCWLLQALGESCSTLQRLKALKSVMVEPRESSELQAKKRVSHGPGQGQHGRPHSCGMAGTFMAKSGSTVPYL